MNTKVTDNYLNNAMHNEDTMAIYLFNGLRLIGCIKEFDDVSILLSTNQLIQRTQIATTQLHKGK